MTRLFDIIFSGLAILVLSPFLLPIVVLLKLTGEHDVFYRQERIGRYGRAFKVIKFATMLRDSPNLAGGLITRQDDPRLLPMGHILRKLKINELPQLLNVFVGDMSIVGYRPFAKSHYDLYSEGVKRTIGRIRPGLSGVGSIIFKNEEEILHEVSDPERLHDTVITPYKGELESWYVEHRNLGSYFMVIVLTVLAFARPGNGLVYKWFQDLPECPEELKKYLVQRSGND